MSRHPNAILFARLVPAINPDETLEAIASAMGTTAEEGSADFKIGARSYDAKLMNEDYDEDIQIAAAEGEIVVYAMVTYGYGETTPWDDLATRQAELAEWAKGICEQHNCTVTFHVTANYW